MTTSKYEFYQQASLSQKVSNRKEFSILKHLAGTDREISDSIGVIRYLGEEGLLDKKESKFILGLLDVLRLSHFATSEKVNEITRLGFMLPKGASEIDFNE